MPEDSLPSWVASALGCEQKRPLLRDVPNAVILAGAGSGKTRTLAHMVLYDLAKGIPAESIVAFTFTEKAADELLARIHSVAAENLPDLDLTGLNVGTIHSWCFRYLLGQSRYYNFSSLDELHVDALVSRLYDPLGLQAAYGKPYPKAIPAFLADLEVFYNECLNIVKVPKCIRGCMKRFLDILEKNRLLTYGGMVNNACLHLEEVGGVPSLNTVYVDEYQDVNPAQVRLINAMLPGREGIVVVGDDLQCIYNWRGSDVTRILSFEKEFPNAKKFRLSANHRSRFGIVNTANAIASHLVTRDADKVMKSSRAKLGFDAVQWLSVSSEPEQTKEIVNIVKRFTDRSVPPSSIAILLRSVIGSGRPIVSALEAEGVPVVCPILSRAGAFIEDFLLPIFDWLRRDHPEPKSRAEEEGEEQAAQSLWDSVYPWLPEAGAELIFWRGVNDWLGVVDAKASAAYDVRGRLYDLLQKCGISICQADSNLMVGLGIASQIIRSVEEIHRRRISGQHRRTPRGIISEIFFALHRNHQDFGESVPLEKVGQGVFISTIHQAKGLEWPVVIVPMLRNGKFPVRPSPHGTSFSNEIAARYGTSVEDERRLFYVAATRAKERLILIDPEGGRPERRSVFLMELGDHDLKPVMTLQNVPREFWTISAHDLAQSETAPVRWSAT